MRLFSVSLLRFLKRKCGQLFSSMCIGIEMELLDSILPCTHTIMTTTSYTDALFEADIVVVNACESIEDPADLLALSAALQTTATPKTQV
jgi:hypothetical protein